MLSCHDLESDITSTCLNTTLRISPRWTLKTSLAIYCRSNLKIILESFTEGRDRGIDLRHSQGTGDPTVQCKRYDDWSSLKSVLERNEVAKLKKLNPKRYILTTSVGLTAANKAEIKTLLKPYVRQQSDIYGRDDLNNLLGGAWA